jgi:hypothetical protein
MNSIIPPQVIEDQAEQFYSSLNESWEIDTETFDTDFFQ